MSGVTAGVTGVTMTDPSASGGGAPSGNAGGDLGGTYPNPTVVQASGLNLYQDAADYDRMRDGTVAQTFAVAGTYTDNSNYEQLQLSYTTGYFTVQAAYAGTGVARNLGLGTGNQTRWYVGTNGYFYPNADQVYDLGGASNRIRSMYSIACPSEGSNIVTANTTLTNTSPKLTVGNSASAITITFATTTLVGQVAEFLNIGTGQMTLSFTGISGTAQTLGTQTVILAQYSSKRYKYLNSTYGWVEIA